MDLMELMVERTAKRIKKVKENPDPTKLRSNVMGFQLDLDLYKAQLAALKTGKPPVAMNVAPWALYYAMGFQPILLPQISSHFPELNPKYLQVIRDQGLPEYPCDFSVYGCAMSLAGDAPTPPFLLRSFAACCIEPYIHNIMINKFDCLTYDIDFPIEYNEKNITYLADQYGELIEYCEKHIPGIEYHEDVLIERLEMDHRGLANTRREWNLKKNIPCPVSNREMHSISQSREPQYAINQYKALEYQRIRLEELEERVAKGIGEKEKMRVIWEGTAPLYFDPFSLLQSKRVTVIPIKGQIGTLKRKWGGARETEEFGRKLSPLEEVARRNMTTNNHKTGKAWVDTIVWAAKEMNADAIMNYQWTGCIPMASLSKLLADAAENEGIPTLVVSGGIMNPENMAAAEFESRLVEFTEMILSQKGKK